MSSADPRAAGRPAGLDGWLDRRADALALLVIAFGLAVRLIAANASFLHPDEILHLMLAEQHGIADAYRASLSNAHPPLFFLLLYCWRFLGTSGFMLRLFSVLAGAAALWPAYHWLRRLAGRSGGLAGLVLLTFMPAMVDLSVQVRHYALLLLFAAAALYCYERAFREESGRMMAWFGVLLGLAALVHYSALILVVALGLHAVVRIAVSRPRRGPVLAWVGTQVGVGAVYLGLYLTHISKIRGSVMAQQAMGDWLRMSYFDPAAGGALGFAASGALAVFRFLFGSPVAGAAGLALFAAGAVFAFLSWRAADRPARERVSTGLLLLLPLLAGAGFGLARLLPFGGTRHVVILAPFAAAGVGLLLGRLVGRRGSLALAVAALAAAAMNLAAVPNPQDMQPQDQRLALMSHALDFVRESIPDRDIILVDYQTRLLLGYYLGRGDADKSYERRGPYLEFKYGGKRVVSAGEATWNFTDGSFEAELDRLAKVFDLEPGDRVWVVDAGCFPRLTPGSGDTTFGANIEVLRRTVGRGPEAVGSLLELAARLAEQGITARISLWPGAELTGPARRAAAAVSNRALTYEEAYRAMGRGEFDFGDLLPALAFWEFGSAERHPEAMRYMDEGENYISAGLRFTLLLTSADGRAAVYLVEEAGDGRRR